MCFLPSKGLPKFSFLAHLYIDKWIHVFLFFVQTGLFLLVKPYVWPFNFKNRFKKILFIVIYCLILGFFIELIQHFFIYGRQGDILDFTADLVGLTIGTVFFLTKKTI